MKKRILSFCIALVLLFTMIPQLAFAAEGDEAAIYTQFLLESGYSELIDGRDKEYLDISTCLIDLDADNVDELLISVTNKSSQGVRGYETITALLDIQGGTAKIVTTAYYGGGSMGGDYLVIKYDTELQKNVLVLSGYLRDGVSAGIGYLNIYGAPNFALSDSIGSTQYYIGDATYREQAKKVRSETTLFYEDGDEFLFYQINDQYVSKEAFDTMMDRFVDPDDTVCQMYSGTYYAPICGYDSKENSSTDSNPQYGGEQVILSSDEQQKINLFLSNFSEQWFNERDPVTYEAITKPFDVQTPNPAQLIRFSYLFNSINYNSVLYETLDTDWYVYLTFEQINSNLRRFFGITLSQEDFQRSGLRVGSDKVYFQWGVGETYNYMTVADSMYAQKDGTFIVPFTIYRAGGKYFYAGGGIQDKSVYKLSPAEAKANEDLEVYLSGEAVVRLYQNGDKV